MWKDMRRVKVGIMIVDKTYAKVIRIKKERIIF